MSKDQHYSNAPITEAIIDLRVRPREGLKIDELSSIRAGDETCYPKQDGLYEAMGMMELRAGVSASASAHQRQTGFRFTSGDGKYICQSRLDGFSVSRLAPYESWEPFRDEARRLWTRYREQVQPAAVERLAVRYINRIDIPAGLIDLKDYFRTSPEVSPELPQELEGFFMQLRIPQLDLQGGVLVNQTIIPPAKEGVLSVVLDIDLFRAKDVPSDEEGIWRFFETLHTRKNNIFEACITDNTRELIN